MDIQKQHQGNTSNHFLKIWSQLSSSQKNIIYKLGLSGWQLDYSNSENKDNEVKIIHYNGNQGNVNSFGEVEYLY